MMAHLSLLRNASNLVCDAAIAAFVLGVVESFRISGGSLLWTPAIAIGLVLPVATAIGASVLMGAALAKRNPVLARWASDFATAGPPRVRSIAFGLAAALTFCLFFAVVYLVTVKTFGRFNAAGALGLLNGAVLAVSAVVLAIIGSAIGGFAAGKLENIALLTRATTGVTGLITLAVSFAAAIAAVLAFANFAAPAADFRPLLLAILFFTALAAVRIVGVGARLPALSVGAVLALAAILTTIGLSQVGKRDTARAAVASAGVPSSAVLRLLWSISDADGDGFASRFGGGDCDDSNPNINPKADERIGNGVDDNCAGGDLQLSEVAHRAKPVPSQTPGAKRHNVILISIDAVRADHMSAYGYSRDTTPRIAKLAETGTRFDWAISASPSTRRAIPAMLGGRYATTFAFVEGGKKKVWPPYLKKGYHWMVGESFKKAGYQTAAILCCTVLFNRKMGVTIGIDDVDASAAKLKRKYHGDHLVKRFDAWLETKRKPERPFFMWIHFIDPHNPYQQLPGAPVYGNKPIDKYDSEIRYVDDRIAEMLAALDEAGLTDDTIIAITSDHGDEFMEHGNRYHGRSLYNELVRIPLIVRVPDQQPSVVAEPVSMVDISPTLLDLVGLERPLGLNGRSLAAATRGGPVPDRMVLAELIADRNITRNLRAGFYGDWKIIWDLDANTYELYSLRDDPGDTRDRQASEPAVFSELKNKLHHVSDLELSLLPSDRHFKERRQSSRPKKSASK